MMLINWLYVSINIVIRHINSRNYLVKIARAISFYFISFALLAIQVQAGNPVPRSYTTIVNNIAYPKASFIPSYKLPVPLGDAYSIDGEENKRWIVKGNISASINGNADAPVLNLNQSTNEALLDWASFDVGENATVNFIQPGEEARVINRIYQGNPVKIRGAIKATGQVFLVNQNGFIFGSTATVDTNSFLVSTLKISDEAIDKGITNVFNSNKAAFEAFFDPDSGQNLSGDIFIEEGFEANIKGKENGRFIAIARNVQNNGVIRAIDGQIILAAGSKAYITTDKSLPGWLIQVDSENLSPTDGIVVNGDSSLSKSRNEGSLIGRLLVGRGNVSIVASSISQNGLISATTSVQRAGSVNLRAQSDTRIFANNRLGPTKSGTVVLGEGSVINISTDESDVAVADQTFQPKSNINIEGRVIHLKKGSRIISNSGNVTLTARQKLDNDRTFNLDKAGDALIYIEGEIDVSGETVTKSVKDNLLTVDLRADEFKDSPVQRNNVLRGEKITFDIRKTGTRENGTAWEGTQLANVSGSIDGIKRTAVERNLTGGAIHIHSSKDVVITSDAKLDISGGAINFSRGIIATTKIVSEGRVLDISKVKENQRISNINKQLTRRLARYESAYVEGKDAGTVTIDSRRLALAGTIKGNTLVGRLQRNKASANIPINRMYRAANETPLAGRLELGAQNPINVIGLGTDYRIKDISLVAQSNIRIPELTEMLDTEYESILLGANLLPGIGRLDLRANGTITVIDPLKLPDYSELTLKSSQVKIAADITSRSGDVDITATQNGLAVDEIFIDLKQNKKIDVSGRWVNDTTFLTAGVDQGVLSVDGGTVKFKAQASSEGQTSSQIRFGSGSEINVSAGAYVTEKGILKSGKAGSISLRASKTGIFIDPSLTNLKAYGFNNSKGGTLSIDTGDLDFTICNSGCFLSPTAFSQSGFTDFNFKSSDSNAEFMIANAIEINIAPLSRITNRSVTRRKTNEDIDSFTSLDRLPEQFSNPVSLTASAYKINLQTNSIINLLADPESKVVLNSTYQTFIDGTINAPAGLITLSQRKAFDSGDSSNWLRHYIWLGKNSRLLSKGASRISQAGFFGIAFGEVFDGGNVEIESGSGYVIAESGAVIDVSATSKVLDIQSFGGRSILFRNVHVAGDAGSIKLAAREGILYQGNLFAQRADTLGSSGGTLTVALLAINDGDRTTDSDREFGINAADRNILLTNKLIGSAVEEFSLGNGVVLSAIDKFGDDISSNLNGLAVITTDLIKNSGIESLNLETYDFLGSSNSIRSKGQVLLQGNIDLSLNKSIRINTPNIVSDGGNAVIQAPFMVMGSEDIRVSSTSENGLLPLQNPVAGTGSVLFNADFIEVSGRLALSGLSKTGFDSTGDIRFRGVRPNETSRNKISGILISAGDLNFTAAQLYATTLSDFTIKTFDSSSETVQNFVGSEIIPEITIARNTNAPTPILSAASKLTFEANKITQNGVIKAPLGQINLIGRSVVLNEADVGNERVFESFLTFGADSITSTSTEGQIIPFGTLQAGKDWVYELANNVYNVVTDDTSLLPTQSIIYKADNLKATEGAMIDIRGGGDLLAYEFVSGVDGTVDILNTAKYPNTYAILPRLNPLIAPYDPFEMANVDLELGRSVFFDAPELGIETGNYTLLPARYSLLPGAYLVQSVEDYQDMVPGVVFKQTDGSDIIAGRFTQNTTGRFASRNVGFRILENDSINKFARYDTALASSYFPAKGFTGRTPIDDGRVSITANKSLSLLAKISAQSGANGGRGSQLDIAANKLAVLTQARKGSYSNDVIELTVEQLLEIGADSLLLGGTRTNTQKNGINITTLDVKATEIYIDSNVDFSSREILLAATDNLNVKQGVSLKAIGGQQNDNEVLALKQDAAVIRLSSFNTARLQRDTSASRTSNLNIERGVSLQAEQAGLFSASNNFSLSGVNLDFATASLTLGANQMNFGSVPQGVEGLNLLVTDINNLKVSELILDSVNSIDFYNSMALSVNNLTLRASAFNAMVDNALVDFNVATSTRIENPAANVTTKTSTGSGTFTVNSKTIELGSTGGEEININGFNALAFNASEKFVVDGEGRLLTKANIKIVSPVVTAANGSEYKIGTVENRTGNIFIASNNLEAAEPVEYLGGRLELASAGNINIDTRISMNSGVLLMNAVGDVSLGNKAFIDLSGRDIDFSGTVKGSKSGYFYAKSDADIKLSKNAVIDVSAGSTSGDAGVIVLSAKNGDVKIDATLLAQHASSQNVTTKGGTFILDAKILSRDVSVESSSFTDLNESLAANGFNQTRSIRLRTGDITVETRKNIVAKNIELIADQGEITVKGVLDARGKQAGSIRLAARNDVTVFGSGDMYANATGKNQNGGRIFIGTTDGVLQLLNGSTLDVSGTDNNRDGIITLRVPRNATNDSILDISKTRINSSFVGAYRVNLEGLQQYDVASINSDLSENITAAKLFKVQSDSEIFMDNASTIKASLGRLESYFHITPGVEINSVTALSLVTNLDLSTWRSNGETSGYVSLRAANDIKIDKNIGDGFASKSSFFGPPVSKSSDMLKTDSWNIRLVAGADLSSVNPMATIEKNNLNSGGNLIIGLGTKSNKRYIRTGTGDIEIAAAKNIILSNSQSVIYTAGRINPTVTYDEHIPEPGSGFFGGGNKLPYASDGGNISLTAGHDIKGAYSTQLVSEWLWRVSDDDKAGFFDIATTKTAWTVSHENFEQNVGIFGGGNVKVSALGDITDLSVMNSSIGSRIFNSSGESNLVINGGGNSNINSLGSIKGGRYLVDRGDMSLAAYNEVGKGTENPVFLLGDSSLNISARSGVTVAGIGQWSLLARSLEEKSVITTAREATLGTSPIGRYFFLYADDNKINLNSVAGNVEFTTDGLSKNQGIKNQIYSSDSGVFNSGTSENYVFSVLAPRLAMTSFSGDININKNLILYPGAMSDLILQADGNININQAILMSDADKSLLPNVNSQLSSLSKLSSIVENGLALNEIFSRISPFAHAAIPVAAGSNQSNGILNVRPVQVVTRNGDIRFGAATVIDTTKAMNMVAGRDLISPAVRIQNLRDTDVSTIRAGRNIIYPTKRNTRTGVVENSKNNLDIAGPGKLYVMAGGDINLGASNGIRSIGNQDNSGLPTGGADVTVMTGISDIPDFTEFITTVIANNTDNYPLLYQYINNLGQSLYNNISSQVEVALVNPALSSLTRKQQLESVMTGILANPEQLNDIYQSLNIAQLVYLYQTGIENSQSGSFDSGLLADSLSVFNSLRPIDQQSLVYSVFYQELRNTGRAVIMDASTDYERGYLVADLLFNDANQGDLSMVFSQIRTTDGGDINILTPNGRVDVGSSAVPDDFGISKLPEDLGIVAEAKGNISAFSWGDFLVNESRVFTADGGDILIWSSNGNIDAGRGAKTALASPDPQTSFDSQGNIIITIPPILLGSGIRATTLTADAKAGNIDLIAPRGVVNAADAGIAGFNIFIPGDVIGLNNIDIAGSASGFNVSDTSVGITLDVAGDITSSITSDVSESISSSGGSKSFGANSLALLFIEILGVTDEEECNPDNDKNCK